MQQSKTIIPLVYVLCVFVKEIQISCGLRLSCLAVSVVHIVGFLRNTVPHSPFGVYSVHHVFCGLLAYF